MRLLMVAIVLAAGPVTCGDTAEEEDATRAPAEPNGPLEVGDRVDAGNVAVTVVEATELEPTDDYAPDAGTRFVGVQLRIENLTEEDVSVSALQQMRLLDDAPKQEYSPNRTATNLALTQQNELPSLEGTIPGNEEIRGVVGFQVPEDATGLVFVFESNVPEERIKPLQFDLDV